MLQRLNAHASAAMTDASARPAISQDRGAALRWGDARRLAGPVSCQNRQKHVSLTFNQRSFMQHFWPFARCNRYNRYVSRWSLFTWASEVFAALHSISWYLLLLTHRWKDQSAIIRYAFQIQPESLLWYAMRQSAPCFCFSELRHRALGPR